MIDPQQLPPASRKALLFLQSLIASRPESAGTRLPSVKQLAVAASVSYKTMWKAANLLAAQNVVECHTGQGIFLKRGNPGQESRALPHAEEPVERGVWRRTASRIAADILSGAHEPGARLPACKEMQRRYGVSFATLKKALVLLQQDGLVAAHGPSLVVKPLWTRSSSVTIVAVHPVEWNRQSGGPGFQQERVYDVLLRHLEELCLRSSIALHVVFRSSSEDGYEYGDRFSREPHDFSEDREVAGYISEVMVGDPAPPDREIAMLASLGRPVAVYNPGDDLRLPDAVAHNRLVKIFRTASDEECGRDIARLLLSLGHRRIAYFSPYHRFEWSRRRLDGMRTTCQAAGRDGAVVPFVLSEFGRRSTFYDAMPAHCRPDAWMRAYCAWVASAGTEYAAAMEPVMQFAAYDGVVRGEVYRRLAPLFGQALEDRAITAWVCANDLTSLFAIDFLEKRGKSVPGDLSVMGFDDTLDALDARLASYNFNISALVNAMVRHVMQPHMAGRFRRPGVERIPGQIVVRSSVAASGHAIPR